MQQGLFCSFNQLPLSFIHLHDKAFSKFFFVYFPKVPILRPHSRDPSAIKITYFYPNVVISKQPGVTTNQTTC